MTLETFFEKFDQFADAPGAVGKMRELVLHLAFSGKLFSSEFVDSIDPGRSNGVPHISTRQVQRLPFVLPPLAEQRRIVAKVSELMALVDELETQLAASRAAAEKLLSALVAELTVTTSRLPADS
jgi:hypothetical protein